MSAGDSRKKLPIGIQTFREIREGGYHYVDKTGFALRPVAEGKYYFHSRRRRFGKSLFLDTPKELFECNRKLFEGLEGETDRDWPVSHPAVRPGFGRGNFAEPDYVHVNLMAQLDRVEPQSGTRSRISTPRLPATWKVWSGIRSASGATVTAGAVRRGSTTPLRSCRCLRSAGSGRGGLKRALQLS